MNYAPTPNSSNIRTIEAEAFNRLPALHDAHRNLVASGHLQLAKSVLQPIFEKFDAGEHWGLALLHRHWDLLADEAAVQRPIESEANTVYVLSPEPLGRRGYPSIIGVCGGELRAFEVTQGNHGVAAAAFLEKHPAFLAEVTSVLVAHGLQRTFGIIALGRSAPAGYEFVEDTTDDRASVVRTVRIGTYPEAQLTETAWSIGTGATALACKSKCFNRGTDHPQYHDPNG